MNEAYTRRMRWIFAFAVLAACGGSSSSPDANTQCTKALYDPCLTEHDCTSGNCHGFMGGPIVCTMACTPTGPACPMQNGAAVDCDASGVCKPPAANACTFTP